MNTSQLQRFAADARRQLMNAVQARLDAALATGSPTQTDMPTVFHALQSEVREHGQDQVVERYAYRWFNRIIAFRYMDVHEFTTTAVVSPADMTSVNALPELLAAAKRGEYDDTVFNGQGTVNAKLRDEIERLLNGSVPVADPQGEAYVLLFQAACRYWSTFMPFMFESTTNPVQAHIDELLMPRDLLAKGSVLRNAIEVITPEACGVGTNDGNVEIIGWLYQFYIAERKTQVMDGLKHSRKAGAAEIPAATQLFTPDWIVRYLVQNTIGKLWMHSHPDCGLDAQWEYYIKPANASDDAMLHIASAQELTVCDPACGSGHMLTYAFDLLYQIYESEGYAPSDIPGMILEHNLFGIDIDERAANLAAFALMMKARGKSRRFFRKQVMPHIIQVQPESFNHEEVESLNDLYHTNLDDATWNIFAHADVYGSLIQPSQDLLKLADNEPDDIETILDEALLERSHQMLNQTRYLGHTYATVVANPPYMGSKNMNSLLKSYVQDHYTPAKADLFAAFILRNRQLLKQGAELGMITMQSWMFLSSFEELRTNLLHAMQFDTMAHLGSGAFDSIGGEVVSTVVFTMKNTIPKPAQDGIYIRLVDIQGDTQQAQTCRAAIHSSADYTFVVDQQEFSQIPGSPIVCWLPETLLDTFSKGTMLGSIHHPYQGLSTGDNDRFVRSWWENGYNNIVFDCVDCNMSFKSEARWFPFNTGGSFRKWYGNQQYVINWINNGKDIYSIRPHSTIRNPQLYFHRSISWSKISSGAPAFRFFPNGYIFGSVTNAFFPKNLAVSNQILGLCNSSYARIVLAALSPTLSFNIGEVSNIPFVECAGHDFNHIGELINASRFDWDSYETSWDFSRLPLFDDRIYAKSLQECIQNLRVEQDAIAEEQRQREILNNQIVADAYGVRDVVNCDVPIERVSLKRNKAFTYPKASPEERNELFERDAVKELISYAVGCMFGRYSLDEPGLILASQGETIDDYHAKVLHPTFEPDADNVIPVTEVDCFEDDIVSRFRRFLAVAFGEEHVAENIAYIEQVLGKTLRKYFVNDFYNDHVKMYSNRPIY